MTSDPILLQFYWYGQRASLFAGGCVTLTVWFWFWLTIHVLDWHVLDAIVQGYYCLTGQATTLNRVLAKGCALVSLLGMTVLYLATALWWHRRGQVEVPVRGSHWSAR